MAAPDAPPTASAYPPTPTVAVQVAASVATATATNTIITMMSSSSSRAGAGLIGVLRNTFTPHRDRALGPILNHQLLHEIIPPLCRASARWERRRGNVSRTETPSLRRALALAVTAGNAAGFPCARAVAATRRSAHDVWTT